MVDHVSIITQNMFQIPWQVVTYFAQFKKDVPVEDCRDQLVRAMRIAPELKQYDVCILQEMWGANSHVIKHALDKSHNIPAKLSDFIWDGVGCCSRKVADNYLANAWNTAKTYLAKTGGLMVATAKSLPLVWYHHHVFKHNLKEESIHKSLGIALLNMSSKWGKGKYLLVCNVHYHSPGPFDHTSDRKQQRAETLEIFTSLDILESFPEDFKWSNCGVIFAGDFNTSQFQYKSAMLSSEYLELLEAFTDVPMRNLREEHSANAFKHTSTFSDTNSYVAQRVYNETSVIDYIFAMDEFPTISGPKTTLRLDAENTYMIKQPHGEEYSDHYPLVATIFPFKE